MQGLVSVERRVSFEEIASVPVPEAKGRYMPVSNADLSRMLIDGVKSKYSLKDEDLDIGFGLSQKDQQLFGSIIVKESALLDREFKSSMMFCFRNSYNKSLSIALLSGANCWICDNGQMVGDLIELRKHTLNVWNDLDTLVTRCVEGGQANFDKAMYHAKQLNRVELDERRMAEITGYARFQGVLMPQQESIVLEEIRNPSHEEHAVQSAWGLYNAFTQGMKHGPAGDSMARHRKTQEFFEAEFDLVA
tara:strand:+ start:461 stop:1204 length:744 start_codon:yes stop_codon:yes gene_type:complete